MNDFLKKYGTALKSIALILMLGIPFLLYQTAMHGSIFQVKLFIGLMMANMLFVMKKG
ncbi:MAG: hypothetical protein GQ556_02165 [Desulfobacterales bacterium]|nr:hypothetical protein [Desulfobacterales bacterium]